MVWMYLLEHFLSLFPHCELSHFSPSVYRQWVLLVSATRLQFCTDRFKTLHMFSSWYEDVHVVWM